MTNPPRKKRKKRKLRWFLLVVVFVLLMALAGLFWYKSALRPTGTSDESVLVEVAAGETFPSVVDQLKKEGIIRSPLAASIYARISGEHNVYEGKYLVDKGMSTPQVLRYLADPANIEKQYAVVTVPEGYWAKQIAALLAHQFPDYTAQDFLDLWNDDAYIEQLAADYSFLDPSVLENDEYFVKLEGYLFPETYHIDYGSSADTITRTFLDQFEKVYETYRDEIDASGMSVQDVITLASIVQFESGSPADMPDIARVFYNRLEQGMDLQSSVTVCYALYDDYNSGTDCEVNYDIDSPYNTYRHPGLPIGPILNPGEAAIQAVLEPADNDYLFFVADIHGDGSVHYAKTLEEHEENIDKYGLRIE